MYLNIGRKRIMVLRIGVIKGDGIGPEIVTEAMKVLDQVAKVYGHTCDYTQLLMGGASIDVHGVPLTDETVAEAKKCDAGLHRGRCEDLALVSVGTVKETGGRIASDS